MSRMFFDFNTSKYAICPYCMDVIIIRYRYLKIFYLLSLCITNRYYKKPMNSNYGIIIDKERKSVKLHIHTREYTKLTHHSLCIPVRRLLDFFFMFFIIIFFSFFYFRRTRRTITRRRNVMHGQKY